MKAYRGRIGQYKILQHQEKLHPYLVPYKRFTKESLYSMLDDYKHIILKPVYGTQFIKISSEKEGFHIKTNELPLVALEKEEVYNIVQQKVSEQHYIIQPEMRQTPLWKKNFSRFITVHKSASKWRVVSTTKILNDFSEALAYLSCFSTLQKVAILAAEQLGKYFPHSNTIVFEMAFNRKEEIFIYDSALHFSVSKWSQYQTLHRFMPKTDLLTAATFQIYLTCYPVVFLKPCNSQNGKGIIKIHKLNAVTYEMHFGITKIIKRTIQEIYETIRQMDGLSDHYIIQKGIALATIDQCFIDLRVITQKIDGVWQVTGKAVKVAGQQYFITNAAQAILPLEEAFKQSTISSINHKKLSAKIDAYCLTAVKELEHQKDITIVGFDVGVTNRGKIGIIEGNYVPDISMFNKLQDKTMYEIIVENRRVVKQPSEQ